MTDSVRIATLERRLYEANVTCDRLRGERDQALTDAADQLAEMTRQRDEAMDGLREWIGKARDRGDRIAELEDVVAQREATLAGHRIELERLRATACHLTNCAACGRPIRCAEPREPLPAAAGYFRHAGGCPQDPPPIPAEDRKDNK